jgi:conjugal transfer pilin signal peptidase TrbI
MGPFYPDGTLVIKRVVGVAGDQVVVAAAGVWVNGVKEGGLLHAAPGGRLWALGHRPVEYERDERVPLNHWWVMGTNPRSFDSRYWGYVEHEQIVGRANPIW